MGLRAVYQWFVKNLRNERQKKDVLKNMRFSNYFMLAVFISLIKFSKIVLRCEILCEVWSFATKTISVRSCMLSKSIESDFSTLNWIADSKKICHVYSREILLNTARIREVNLTEIDSNFTARETQDYAPLQRQTTNNQTNFHNLKTRNSGLEKYLTSTLPVGQVTLKFCLPGALPRLPKYSNSLIIHEPKNGSQSTSVF